MSFKSDSTFNYINFVKSYWKRMFTTSPFLRKDKCTILLRSLTVLNRLILKPKTTPWSRQINVPIRRQWEVVESHGWHLNQVQGFSTFKILYVCNSGLSQRRSYDRRNGIIVIFRHIADNIRNGDFRENILRTLT